MRRRVRLVSSNDPANIFDDLDQLRAYQSDAGPRRRQRSMETFARIPHDKAIGLYPHRLSNAAWVTLIELDRIILKHRGQNPVKFVSSRLRKIGLKGQTRARALRRLEETGVIEIEHRGRGLAPYVRHLWYPLQD
jgi:hypothetical protein